MIQNGCWNDYLSNGGECVCQFEEIRTRVYLAILNFCHTFYGRREGVYVGGRVGGIEGDTSWLWLLGGEGYPKKGDGSGCGGECPKPARKLFRR